MLQTWSSALGWRYSWRCDNNSHRGDCFKIQPLDAWKLSSKRANYQQVTRHGTLFSMSPWMQREKKGVNYSSCNRETLLAFYPKVPSEARALGCQESPFLSVLPGATTNHCHVMSKFWEEGARIRRSYTVKCILVHNEQISSIKAPLKKRKQETHKSSSHRRLKITWYLYLSMYYTKY